MDKATGNSKVSQNSIAPSMPASTRSISAIKGHSTYVHSWPCWLSYDSKGFAWGLPVWRFADRYTPQPASCIQLSLLPLTWGKI